MKRFILLYIFYLAIFFILVDYEPMRKLLHLEEFYNGAITAISAWFIQHIGIEVGYSGNVLHLPHANMIIKFGCNGLEAVLIYVAGILAYPASKRAKIVGVVVGIVVLELINILRIALLAYVLERYPDIFALMHDYVTQSIMIVLAFILFLLYLQRVSDEKPGA